MRRLRRIMTGIAGSNLELWVIEAVALSFVALLILLNFVLPGGVDPADPRVP